MQGDELRLFWQNRANKLFGFTMNFTQKRFGLTRQVQLRYNPRYGPVETLIRREYDRA